MYVWLVCFVVLFGLAELYPWVQGVVLPFPLMLLAGVGLAIASNLSGSNLSGSNLNQRSGLSEPSTPPSQVPAPAAIAAEATSAPAVPSPHPQTLPQSLTTSPPPDTISFTIRKP